MISNLFSYHVEQRKQRLRRKILAPVTEETRLGRMSCSNNNLIRNQEKDQREWKTFGCSDQNYRPDGKTKTNLYFPQHYLETLLLQCSHVSR